MRNVPQGLVPLLSGACLGKARISHRVGRTMKTLWCTYHDIVAKLVEPVLGSVEVGCAVSAVGVALRLPTIAWAVAIVVNDQRVTARLAVGPLPLPTLKSRTRLVRAVRRVVLADTFQRHRR